MKKVETIRFVAEDGRPFLTEFACAEHEKWIKAMLSIKPQYLGDGVYASFDNFQIWLATSEANAPAIALEPKVFSALLQYARQINQAAAQRYFNIE